MGPSEVCPKCPQRTAIDSAKHKRTVAISDTRATVKCQRISHPVLPGEVTKHRVITAILRFTYFHVITGSSGRIDSGTAEKGTLKRLTAPFASVTVTSRSPL